MYILLILWLSFRCRSLTKSWSSSGVSLILRACFSRIYSVGSAAIEGEARPDEPVVEVDSEMDEVAVLGGDVIIPGVCIWWCWWPIWASNSPLVVVSVSGGGSGPRVVIRLLLLLLVLLNWLWFDGGDEDVDEGDDEEDEDEDELELDWDEDGDEASDELLLLLLFAVIPVGLYDADRCTLRREYIDLLWCFRLVFLNYISI